MKPRKPIAQVSARQRERNQRYYAARRESRKTAPRFCPVMLELQSKSIRVKDVHHVYGRLGPLRWWIPGFLWVSREGHEWIEANKKEARKHGWLAPLGEFNNTKLCEGGGDGWYCDECYKHMPENANGYVHSNKICYCSKNCAEEWEANLGEFRNRQPKETK